MLGIINRGLSYKSAEVIQIICQTSEYCIQFWSPINVKDADMVDWVQRRATKMVPSLETYHRRKDRKGWVCFHKSIGDSGVI